MNDRTDCKIGDKILWCGQLTGPEHIRSGTVTRVNEKHQLVWVDNEHAPEDCLMVAYVWPARVEAELRAILTERARLQKLADDSMKLLYELSNAIARGEK